MSQSYGFRGCPLTPHSAIRLIPNLLLADKGSKRSELVPLVVERHEELGGIAAESNPVAVVKRALQLLAAEGTIQNRGYGMWFLSTEKDSELEYEDDDEDDDSSCQPLVTYGEGLESVYLYHYPQYEAKGAFPCKIGMTRGSAVGRIRSQQSTAMPEMPVVDWVIKVDDALLVEKFLHSALALQGKKKEGSPGSEWFVIEPSEPLKLLKGIGINCGS